MITFLDTSRLILRPVEENDAEIFAQYINDARFSAYITQVNTLDEMRDRVKRWIASNQEQPQEKFIWTIVETSSGTIIGNIRFWPANALRRNGLPAIAVLGYGLDPHHWGKGYMSEAIKAVLDYAHGTLKIHRVEAEAHADNIGSWKVMEKVGMQREGEKRFGFFAQNDWWPLLYQYASVRPELLHES